MHVCGLTWSHSISLLLRKLFDYHGTVVNGQLNDNLDTLAKERIPEEEFTMFISDSEVVRALDELEIGRADHKVMFDILDNDNTGTIYIYQLVDGLRRLRGDPRRSDIITVDLMVRSIQEQTDMLVEGSRNILDRLSSVLRKLERPAGTQVVHGKAADDKVGDVMEDSSESISPPWFQPFEERVTTILDMILRIGETHRQQLQRGFPCPRAPGASMT